MYYLLGVSTENMHFLIYIFSVVFPIKRPHWTCQWRNWVNKYYISLGICGSVFGHPVPGQQLNCVFYLMKVVWIEACYCSVFFSFIRNLKSKGTFGLKIVVSCPFQKMSLRISFDGGWKSAFLMGEGLILSTFFFTYERVFIQTNL